MNIMNDRTLQTCLTLIVVNCISYASHVSANEWWDGGDVQSGFSDFAPPTELHEERTKYNKNWRSGSSFNQTNKVRYMPVTSRNPWKPVSKMHYKKSFGGQRPWGNVPDRKPPKSNNMKYHDQRFKQWSRKQDAAYHNNFASSSDPFNSFGRSSFPYANGYGFPGAMYSSPLITPSIYPGYISGPRGYGAYPGNYNRYSGNFNRYAGNFNRFAGLTGKPWGW